MLVRAPHQACDTSLFFLFIYFFYYYYYYYYFDSVLRRTPRNTTWYITCGQCGARTHTRHIGEIAKFCLRVCRMDFQGSRESPVFLCVCVFFFFFFFFFSHTFVCNKSRKGNNKIMYFTSNGLYRKTDITSHALRV